MIAPSPLSELTVLAPSWQRTLSAQNKSPRTIVAYLEGLTLFATYVRHARMPTNVTHVRREHVESFVADQVARWRPSTASTRYRSLQQFFRWCLATALELGLAQVPVVFLTGAQARAMFRTYSHAQPAELLRNVHVRRAFRRIEDLARTEDLRAVSGEATPRALI